MGRIFSAANRAEGFKLAAREGPLVIATDVVLWTCRCSFRFCSGRPMFGDHHRKTDATFRRDGTRQLHRNDRPPVRWSWLAEWKRAAIRFAALTDGVATAWAYWGHGTSAFIAALIAIVITGNVAWFLCRRTGTRVRTMTNDRGVVRPLREALSPILQVDPSNVNVIIPPRNRP